MALDRLGDWDRFSLQVLKHIKGYTIPQYQSQDAEQDQVNIWTAADCVTAIRKYTSRFGKNSRGSKEALRDLLKIAHYAQFAYDKLKQELNEKDVY
jgi:hypothetical protein